MKAYIFPGQGAQFPGMGKELHEHSQQAREQFRQANEILGFDISKIMFEGSPEELKQTNITQPAIFLHSVILATALGDNFKPDMAAGHSLGEISALVACGTMDFSDGLKLVQIRANAMQKACELEPSTMAAVLGLKDHEVESVCMNIPGLVVPANYNSPGQLVISGTMDAVEKACDMLKKAGAKRAIILPVGGAFHSPLMEPARTELELAINKTEFKQPICPIYQNVVAEGLINPEEIKQNLVSQLTNPVKWTQSVQKMIEDGATHFIEVGPGKVLQGLVRQINKEVKTESATF